MKNRQYGGLCRSYGQQRMIKTAILFPLALNLCIQEMKGVPFMHLFGVLANTVGASSIGYYMALTAYHLTNELLKNNNVALSTGRKVVRSAQIAAFSIPIAVATIFNTVSEPNKYAFPDYRPNFSIGQKTTAPENTDAAALMVMNRDI